MIGNQISGIVHGLPTTVHRLPITDYRLPVTDYQTPTMTYFGFLLRFLGVPIVVLSIVTWLDYRRGKPIPANFRAWPVWAGILLHVVVAVVYTTPWDNYLVATGVWYYDPALVTGIVLGWVPIEEYTFFVLQPILVGLWLVLLSQHLEFRPEPLRATSATATGCLAATDAGNRHTDDADSGQPLAGEPATAAGDSTVE